MKTYILPKLTRIGLIVALICLFATIGQPAELPPGRAKQIRTDTTNFGTNLSAADTDVQKALDTIDDMAGGGGATALDDIGDPDAATSISLDDTETITFPNTQNTAGSVLKIDNTTADVTNNVYLLDLEYADDGQANADFFKCSDNNGDVKFSIQEEGNTTIAGTLAVTGAITEGGNAVYNSTENCGGELGGTWASPTIDDSVAVTSWNLTTPTITTSLTTSTPTTLSAAELDRLDGLAGIIVTDATACTDVEGANLTIAAGVLNVDNPVVANVTGNVSGSSGSCTGNAATVTNGAYTTNNLSVFAATTSAQLYGVISDETGSGAGSPLAVFNQSPTINGATLTGTIDGGGATGIEIENTAGDVTLSNAGEIAVDTAQKQLAVHDGVEKAIPLQHMIFSPLYLTGAYDVDAEYPLIHLDTTVFPDGIVILGWSLSATVADPTTEFQGDLKYCDDIGTGAFPGANATLIDVMDTTTGNSSEGTMSNSDLGSGVIPADKWIYILMDVDPTDTTVFWVMKITYYIPES